MPFSTGKRQCFKLPTEKLKNFWISELTQGFWRTDLLSQSKDSETCKQHLTTRLKRWRAHSLTTYSFLHFKHIDSTLLTWESGLFDVFLWFRNPAFISPWTSLRDGQFSTLLTSSTLFGYNKPHRLRTLGNNNGDQRKRLEYDTKKRPW